MDIAYYREVAATKSLLCAGCKTKHSQVLTIIRRDVPHPRKLRLCDQCVEGLHGLYRGLFQRGIRDDETERPRIGQYWRASPKHAAHRIHKSVEDPNYSGGGYVQFGDESRLSWLELTDQWERSR